MPDWNSYFEIGGIVLDGTTDYHHASGKQIKRGLTNAKPHLVATGISNLITRNLSERDGIPYSDFQLELRRNIQNNRRMLRRVISAAPVTAPIAVGGLMLLTASEMWTYAVGSYDMYTPEIQTYEESLTLGSMTTRVI